MGDTRDDRGGRGVEDTATRDDGGGVGSKWRGYGRGAGVVEGTATRDDEGVVGVSGVGK